MKKLLMILVMLAFGLTTAFAGSIAGKVVDKATGEALSGANVYVEGTSIGAATDADGMYFFEIDDGTYTLVCSFVGYIEAEQEITVAGETAQLNFEIKSSILRTSNIIVEASRAKERETPVAFTDIGADEITKKFTVQDVPHLFVNTPGVYVTTDGGSGMGDSKVSIRGFDEQRMSVMINNIEVNDPESKKVYWSNWGSLPSGSQSIQVQRGAGSSLYGAGAFGGSINVLTADAPAVSSLKFNTTAGLYETFKLGVDYNTGLFMDNKMSFITRINYMNGNGWRDDTYYKGMSYYFGLSYFMNQQHTLRVVLHGAPQYHAYSYYSVPASDYAKYGRSYNSHPYVDENDPGLTDREEDGTSLLDMLMFSHNDKDKGGEVIGNGHISFDNNVYHKPQFEVHHTWDINEKSYLQTTAFFSMGRGYGENVQDVWKFSVFGIRPDDGKLTMDNIIGLGTYQARAYSIHNQMGIVSTYNTKWLEHDISFGTEARYWWARHYGLITNTFEQETIKYKIAGGSSKPFGVDAYLREGDVYYDYTGIKPNISIFGHALWKFGDLSVMTDLQYSARIYNIKEDLPGSNNAPDPNGSFVFGQNIEGGNNDGYQNIPDSVKFSLVDYDKTYDFISPKLGVNYNIDKNVNVFANYSRVYNEPRVKYFFNYGKPNDDLDIETSDDFELGFGYVNTGFNMKLNLYRIYFDNKSYRIQDPSMADKQGYDYKGRRYVTVGEAVYQGIEFSSNIQLSKNLDLGLSVTSMENAWGNAISEEAQSELGIEEGKIEPGTPQFMLTGVLNYIRGPFFMSASARYNKDYYILPDNDYIALEYDVTNDVSTHSAAVLDDWAVVDLIIGWNQKFMGVDLSASFHLNNLFNEDFYQIGNEYGLIPGPERNAMLNLTIGL